MKLPQMTSIFRKPVRNILFINFIFIFGYVSPCSPCKFSTILLVTVVSTLIYLSPLDALFSVFFFVTDRLLSMFVSWFSLFVVLSSFPDSFLQNAIWLCSCVMYSFALMFFVPSQTSSVSVRVIPPIAGHNVYS